MSFIFHFIGFAVSGWLTHFFFFKMRANEGKSALNYLKTDIGIGGSFGKKIKFSFLDVFYQILALPCLLATLYFGWQVLVMFGGGG